MLAKSHNSILILENLHNQALSCVKYFNTINIRFYLNIISESNLFYKPK